MLHSVTEPTPWSGGAMVFKTSEEEAGHGARFGVAWAWAVLREREEASPLVRE